jgi:hypothetical protein
MRVVAKYFDDLIPEELDAHRPRHDEAPEQRALLSDEGNQCGSDRRRYHRHADHG